MSHVRPTTFEAHGESGVGCLRLREGCFVVSARRALLCCNEASAEHGPGSPSQQTLPYALSVPYPASRDHGCLMCLGTYLRERLEKWAVRLHVSACLRALADEIVCANI